MYFINSSVVNCNRLGQFVILFKRLDRKKFKCCKFTGSKCFFFFCNSVKLKVNIETENLLTNLSRVNFLRYIFIKTAKTTPADHDDLSSLNNPLAAFTSLARSNRTRSVPSVLSHFSDNDLLGNDAVTFSVFIFIIIAWRIVRNPFSLNP